MEMDVREELFSEDYETLKHTALRSLTLTLGLSPTPNGREGYVASPYRATPKFAPLKLRKLYYYISPERKSGFAGLR